MLNAKWVQGKFLCLGLDTDYSKIPDCICSAVIGTGNRIFAFNTNIIDQTKDLVCSYKLNLAFYLEHGPEGIKTLKDTVEYIRLLAPDVPIILDAKFGDIGNTNSAYAKFAFVYCEVDAVTVSPYLGHEAMKPFLDYKDKGIIVLCKTSNPGSGEFQDLKIFVDIPEGIIEPPFKFLYEVVAKTVSNKNLWNYNENCLLVVGATYPEDLAKISVIIGGMPKLVPGIGAQGGTVLDVIGKGLNNDGTGLIINSSREVIFASSNSDFAQKARDKVIEINGKITEAVNEVLTFRLGE